MLLGGPPKVGDRLVVIVPGSALQRVVRVEGTTERTLTLSGPTLGTAQVYERAAVELVRRVVDQPARPAGSGER